MRKGYFKSVFSDKTALIFGIIYAVLCILARVISENPYDMIHKLDSGGVIPPLWIFNLLSTAWCFIAGFASGIVLSEVKLCRARGEQEIRAYQGGLFFISLVFLSLIWYPLFFVSERLFLSFSVSLAAAVCACLCSLLWKRVSCFSSLICAAYSLWLVYVLALNLAVLLKI